MGHLRKISWLGVVVSAVVSLASVASAQDAPAAAKDPCAPPNVKTDIRPNADGPPTEVFVGRVMVDLLGIDDVSQTMTADFGVRLTWTDPRLADLEGCKVPLDDVWSPGLTFLNSGRILSSRPRVADIGPGSQVAYLQRYFGTIATYHNLRDFPFDRQKITVSLVPMDSSEREVRLIADEEFTGRRDLLNISDWTIGSVTGSIGPQYLGALDRIHSRFDFTIGASRIRTFYLWKIILPVCLIVAMSWCVFWISPAQFGTQIGLSATSMLTLIAFIFATTNMVPALGYFTLLDLFIGGSTILVFLALLETVATSYLASNDKATTATRMDRFCRVMFPAAFVALLVSLVLRIA